MQKISNNRKFFSCKRKTPLMKSAEHMPRTNKISIKMSQGYRKIPKLINQIQNNIRLLKKCYQQQHGNLQQKHSKLIRRDISHSHSSQQTKKVKNIENHEQQQTTTLYDLDQLKKSFVNTYGYDTNNIVQLYNFYKKNLQKSTGLFGSTSLSNMVNLTHNHSQLKDKCTRPQTAYILPANDSQIGLKQKQQAIKCQQNYTSKSNRNSLNSCTNKLPVVQVAQSLIKRTNEMVSVSSLLAEKKKISRKNICQNMNSQNLLYQAKRRLYKQNPHQNIQRFNKLKENIRNQNIRISPSRLNKIQRLRQSSQKKTGTKNLNQIQLSEKKNEKNNVKEKQNMLSNKKQKVKDIKDLISENSPIQAISQINAKAQIQELAQQINIKITVTEQQKTHEKLKVIKDENSNNSKQRQKEKQLKQLKSAKSSRSVRSIKSPNSIKSPSLNQAVILDLTGSCEESGRRVQPSYFVPRVNTNHNDSLLDCQITPKQQSKIIDLQSIPFDF